MIGVSKGTGSTEAAQAANQSDIGRDSLYDMVRVSCVIVISGHHVIAKR